VSENKESDGNTSGEAEVEWGTRETIDSSNSWLYNQVAVSSREGYDLSSLWHVSQNDIFCGNNRRDISGEISIVV